MCGPSPWRTVRHNGFDWMVRENAGVFWVVRLPDRAVWMLDQMPEWGESMSEHARVAPSSLALTVACHASLQLQESVPPMPETDEEAEGTAAHWVARRYLAGYGNELPVGAKFISNGKEWTVDADMFAGARLYERAMGGQHPDMQIERRVEIPRIHLNYCSGTPDGFRYFEDARDAYITEATLGETPQGLPADLFHAGRLRLIRVGEYKYGHRYVEVFRNHQMSGYASGVTELYELSEDDETIFVELILVQPRSYHPDGPVRVWRVPLPALNTTIIEAGNAARYALIPLDDVSHAPRARTGTHCVDCRARHVCGTLQVNTQRLVDFAHGPERVDLPPMAMGQELMIIEDAIERLEARRTGLAAQAEAMLRAGKPVPFYHMEPGQSKLTYFDNVNADELVGLGDLLGINLRRTLALKDQIVTPSQAIQLGIDADVMKSYARRPTGALRLARDNSITPQKVFSK